MRAALDGIRRSGNRTWEARTLTVLASIEMALGMASDAQRSCEDARRIFQDLGEREEALDALAILGDVAVYRGDLPRALAVFDEMATAPGRVGYQRADIAVSPVRCVPDGRHGGGSGRGARRGSWTANACPP